MTSQKNSFNVVEQIDITKLVAVTRFENVCRKTKIKPLQMGLWCITNRTKRIL